MGTQENPLSAAPLQVGLGEKVSGSDSLVGTTTPGRPAGSAAQGGPRSVL